MPIAKTPLAERSAASGIAAAMPRRKRQQLDVAWVFVAMGAFLRIYQYAWNRSLFIDEAALALSLRTHTFAELLGRLDHAQFAPIGFLYLQKLLRELFGESEFVLRAPALAAGLLSLPLFFILANRILPPTAAWLAVALFALSRHLIFWSSDAKPYAFDVLATIVLLLLALDWTTQPSRRTAVRLGLAGAIAPFFATTSLLLQAGLGLWLLARALKSRASQGAWIFVIWLAALPAVLHPRLSLSSGDRTFYRAYWSDGFLPFPFEPGALQSYVRQVFRSLHDPLGFGYPTPAFIALIGIVAGAVWLAYERRSMASLLFVPVVVIGLASMARLYPIGHQWLFSGRVILFLTPIGYLTMAAALGWLRRPAPTAALGATILFSAAVPAIATTPWTRSEVRGALEYVQSRDRPGDAIYLYYGIMSLVEYYRPAFEGDVMVGRCWPTEREAYLRELDTMRGRSRVWVVLGHDAQNEHALILDYLSRNARQLDRASYPLAEVRLYDMTAASRGVARADLVHPPGSPPPEMACRGTKAPPSYRM